MGVSESVPVCLYSIRDVKSELYGPVFQCESDAEAVRSFVALMLSPSTLSQFPEDYALFAVGRFDRVTGLFSDYGVPRLLLSAPAACTLADKFRLRQVKGGAVGETGKPVAPEDSEASAERHGSGSCDVSDPLPFQKSYKDTPDMLNHNNASVEDANKE